MNIPIIKQVPPELIGEKILYCSDQGKFFSAQGRELKPNFSPCGHTRKKGYCYPMMRQFAARLCHHLVWETFVGPRTKGMEIDHINGDKMNWSLANLEEVTPAENRKRAKILRAMRGAGNDPKNYTPEHLKRIFAQYDLCDPTVLM
ncbi:MAG: HNH endonuclease, partial [Paludibacteraceae bacterium]|nr:HNH endonuclease [Paludibacteraceae bacterium]